ncbi:YoaK family protein [Georgenia wutianyii]|uniref:YoaK family protein n=1 Tax=Georgenia wutianyii TaxID=2585135 RepID=UPI00143DCFA8|nr:YoaK family protein [Georgenia wutianyii]
MAESTRALVVTGLLLLTCASGVVDALCYFSLDQVFAGNMTGNVLFLGFALVGEAGNPVNNGIAVLGFLVGATAAGRLVPHGRRDVVPTSTLWTLAGGTTFAALLCGAWVLAGDLGTGGTLAVSALLSVVMGSQLNAVKPIGNANITTVVVTGTLGNLARDSRLAGAPPDVHSNWVDRSLAVVALALGAAAGAALDRRVSPAAALGLAVVLMLAGAAVLLVVRRRQLTARRAALQAG